jgi:hypothetical protein
LRARFIVIVIGPLEKQNQLFEVGRAISTCLADDVSVFKQIGQIYFN